MHRLNSGERITRGKIFDAVLETTKQFAPYEGERANYPEETSLARLVYGLNPLALDPFWSQTFQRLGIRQGRIGNVFANLTWPHEKASPKALKGLARMHQISLGLNPLPVRISSSLGRVFDRIVSVHQSISSKHIKDQSWGEIWEGRIAEVREFVEQGLVADGLSVEAGAFGQFTRAIIESHPRVEKFNRRRRYDLVEASEQAVLWEVLKREQRDMGANPWEPVALIGLRGGRVLGPRSVRMLGRTEFIVAT